MRVVKTVTAGVGTLLLLSACAHQPVGPSVAVLPGPNKPFAVFQQEQASCERYADEQVAGRAHTANDDALETGVVTTGLGALLGAAVGGGSGAGVGAATGAILGTAIGTDTTRRDQYGLQQGYNIAYSQCMYAKGNQVPGARFAAPPPPPPLPVR
jgi:hypothetical protein